MCVDCYYYCGGGGGDGGVGGGGGGEGGVYLGIHPLLTIALLGTPCPVINTHVGITQHIIIIYLE